MKKVLAIVLSVLLLFTALPLGAVSVSAATSGTTGSCTWTLNGTVLTISGEGAMEDYTETQQVGDTLISTTLYSTPWGKDITSVTIENGVTAIGGGAFYGCSKLTSVTIGNNVTSIGQYAFGSCTSLTTISLPNSVITIERYAFDSCRSLKKVTIGNSVTTIHSRAFEYCRSLTAIFVDENNPNYSSLDGVLFNKEQTALIWFPRTKSGVYTIPDSVTTIGTRAFESCISLTAVTIPNSVTTIGSRAFESCRSLTAIFVDENNPNYSSLDGVLFNKEQTALIWFPRTKSGAYTIPDSVTTIGNYAFDSCTSLTAVTIPDSVTTIGNHAFYGCSSLTSVIIGDGVSTIGDHAFEYCHSLTSVTIGDSVETIGASAFSGCSSLTALTLPGSLLTIGDGAFSWCELSEINIPAGTNFNIDAFSGYSPRINVDAHNPYYASVSGVLFNKNKTTLLRYPSGRWGAYTIPDSVVTIGDDAFSYCYSLTSVTIPDGITTIGYRAFDSCDSLKSVTIPNSVTAIEQWAFNCCDNLTDVYYGGTREDRDNISIHSSNNELLNATWHYYCDGHVYDNDCDPDCNKCGEERKDLGHVYDGICDPDCNECGAVRDVPDHWYELVYDCDPTCGMEGFAEYICVYCGHFYSDITPATGNHTYDHECDRDCNTCGFTREVGDHFYDTACDPDCIFCGFIREVPDHVYDDEYDADCNVCGEIREVPEKPILPGDANDDGAVNTRDLALLQQYLAGWEATLDRAAADANGDGAINTRDVALLQQYLSGWDVILG